MFAAWCLNLGLLLVPDVANPSVPCLGKGVG